MHISSTYHLLWLIPAILVSVGLAWLLYRKSNYRTPIKQILMGLRAITLFIICIILLGLIFNYTSSEEQKPLLTIFVDKSNSAKGINYQLLTQKNINSLKSKFDVRLYQFAQYCSPFSDSISNAQRSNYSNVFDYLNENIDLKKIGACVIAGDGIYNAGINPIFRYSNNQFPVFTIGYGDTNQFPDAWVNTISANETVFLGNEFIVESSVQSNINKNVTYNVQISEAGKLLSQLTVNGTAYVQASFTLKASVPGIHRYSVSVTPLQNEKNVSNNSKSITVNVTDTRKKIGIWYYAPHPDIAAISNALEKNEQFSVIKTAIPTPALWECDLIIFHGTLINQELAKQMKNADANGIPSIVILSANSSNAALRTFDPTLGFNINQGMSNEAQGSFNANFGEFIVEKGLNNKIGNWPPINAIFGSYSASASDFILAYQKIGSVNTSLPLILYTQTGAVKHGFIFGDGIWKWRLKDYQQESNFEAFDELISKSILFCGNEGIKQPFKLWPSKFDYEPSENITMFASFYNKSGEAVNAENVEIEVTGKNRLVQKGIMAKVNKGYRFELSNVVAGEYNATAVINNNGKKHAAQTKFAVNDIAMEQAQTVANHQILQNLSEKSGGKFFYGEQTQDCINELNKIKTQPVLIEKQKNNSLINWKWPFFIVLILASLEWFLRKREGAI